MADALEEQRGIPDVQTLPFEDRYARRATLVTSQLPIEHWHDVVGDATFGDAILDRLVHHAHRIHLTGASMRRHAPTTT